MSLKKGNGAGAISHSTKTLFISNREDKITNNRAALKLPRQSAMLRKLPNFGERDHYISSFVYETLLSRYPCNDHIFYSLRGFYRNRHRWAVVRPINENPSFCYTRYTLCWRPYGSYRDWLFKLAGGEIPR